MSKLKKTPPELQRILREAAREAGPWPQNMNVIIFPLDGSWRIVVSYSDASQQPFRDKLMELSRHLRELYDLDEHWRDTPHEGLSRHRRCDSADDPAAPEPSRPRSRRSTISKKVVG
jgi:hypothetical protein